jgi:hypothetical protein
LGAFRFAESRVRVAALKCEAGAATRMQASVQRVEDEAQSRAGAGRALASTGQADASKKPSSKAHMRRRPWQRHEDSRGSAPHARACRVGRRRGDLRVLSCPRAL